MRTPRIALVSVLAVGGQHPITPAVAQEGVPCVQLPQPELEPNDTAAVATPLTGLGPFVMARAPASIGVPGDVDYFRVQASSPSRLSVLVDTAVLPQNAGSTTRDSVVQILGSNGTTVLELDDDDGTGLAFGPVTGGEASAVVGLTVNGTVYIRVTAKTPSDVLSPYVLWVSLDNVPFGNETEPNDTSATAIFMNVPMLGSLSGPGDVDWYRRVFLGGGPHAVLIDGDPERDGTTTDVQIDFEPVVPPPPQINSSIGSGSPPPGAEMAYLGTYGILSPAFRLLGPAAGTYSVTLAYIGGDDCQVPVELTSFEVR
jgi:hypothetical protein